MYRIRKTANEFSHTTPYNWKYELVDDNFRVVYTQLSNSPVPPRYVLTKQARLNSRLLLDEVAP